MKVKSLLSLFAILILLSIFSSSVLAISASIGNARMVLRAEVIPGEVTTIERTIKVNNVNEIPVMVELIPSEDMEGRTTLIDNELVIQPDESKDFRFSIDIYSPGQYEGSIGVKFYPVEDGVVQGSGIGLQSSIIIMATGPESGAYLPEPASVTDAKKNREEEASSVMLPEVSQEASKDIPSKNTKDKEIKPELINIEDEPQEVVSTNNNQAELIETEDTNSEELANTSSIKGPNPIIGIAIMLLIIIAGVVLYSLVQKMRE